MEEIKIIYKGTKITFDVQTEEWVAKLNIENTSGDDTLKRHKSLKNLKDAVDRFNKKGFKPIPVLVLSGYGDKTLENAEIISFTEVLGECWVKYNEDGRREKINTTGRGYSSSKKIYACGHIFNEPILMKITETDGEIEKLEKELAQKRKNKNHLIDSLQVFDIGGFAVALEPEE